MLLNRTIAAASVALLALFACASAPAVSHAASTTTAYVAVLDFASLPYGGPEFAEARQLMEQRLDEMAAAGLIDHGLLIRDVAKNGGSTPVGMLYAMLLYGADEQQARELLEAMAGTRNLKNHRLQTALVFEPELLVLPGEGVVHAGQLAEVEDIFVYVPDAVPDREAALILEGWFEERFGKQADFSVGPLFQGQPRAVTYRVIDPNEHAVPIRLSEMPLEFRRNYAVGQMGAQWDTYDFGEPWFHGPIPVKTMSGAQWVKGYKVRFQRLDAATDETVARLNADAAEFTRQVRERYPSAAVSLEFKDQRELRSGVQMQPSLTLSVAVEDQQFLNSLAEQLSTRAALDAGYPRIMWVSASYRVPFHGAAALAQPGSLYSEGLKSERGLIFPPDMSAEAIASEVAHWQEQWLELWQASDQTEASIVSSWL